CVPSSTVALIAVRSSPRALSRRHNSGGSAFGHTLYTTFVLIEIGLHARRKLPAVRFDLRQPVGKRNTAAEAADTGRRRAKTVRGGLSLMAALRILTATESSAAGSSEAASETSLEQVSERRATIPPPEPVRRLPRRSASSISWGGSERSRRWHRRRQPL